MLHLFNKTYLEFDDKIEINFDRVVISDQYGIPMHQELDKVSYGELIQFGKSFDEVVLVFVFAAATTVAEDVLFDVTSVFS